MTEGNKKKVIVLTHGLTDDRIDEIVTKLSEHFTEDQYELCDDSSKVNLSDYDVAIGKNATLVNTSNTSYIPTERQILELSKDIDKKISRSMTYEKPFKNPKGKNSWKSTNKFHS